MDQRCFSNKLGKRKKSLLAQEKFQASDHPQIRHHIEITSWKMRAYDFYSRVEKYQKTNGE